MKISELAELLNGKIENLSEDIEIKKAKSLKTADKESISFLADKKLLSEAVSSQAGAIIVDKFYPEINTTQIIVKNPKEAFYKVLDILYPDDEVIPSVAKTAVIGKNVKLGKNVVIKDYVVIEENVDIGDNTVIYPFSYIGKNTKIGKNCTIYPHVTLYKNTTIGDRTIIHAGSVIAGDGFGYYQKNGKHQKIKHVGNVVIGEDVEIGANTTIDRAMVDETIVRDGTKIDNLVMLGHNVEVGENTILVSQVGIAGSSKIGKNCILAGQVGVADHITIGDNVIVTAKSGVGKDLPPNNVYGSSLHAIEWKKWKKIMFYIYKLPDIIKKLNPLK